MEILSKGQDYIKAGLSVHLLVPGEKRPLQNAWSSIPTINERELIEEFKETPDANLGVRLGTFSCIDSRYLYVLDLDISSNDPLQIKQAYKKLGEIYKDYDKLACVRSASVNSRHFYFLSKTLLKTKKLAHSEGKVTVKVKGEDKVKNAWEIDLCSTGKQVVLPPSHFNGRTYQWERDLLEYLADDSKKALMIIDDISMMSLELENDPQKGSTDIEIKSFKVSEIKESLDKLPKDWHDNYDQWLKVGMAIHYHFSDTEDEQEAIALYDEFSKKSDKYEKGAAYKKWKSFEKKEDGITLGTIFHHIPKDKKDDFKKFAEFLNNEKVDFDTLRQKLEEFDLKDYQIDTHMDLIASALTKGLGKKITSISARSTVKSLRKEIYFKKEAAFEKLAIGLDDTLATMILNEEFNGAKYLLNLNNNIFHYKKGVWVPFEMSILSKTVLNGIKKIIYSEDEKYHSIQNVIFKKKKNDDLNGLTNQIVSIILKMVATPEHEDILNLKNTAENKFSVVNTLNKEIYISNGKITVEEHKHDSYLITQFNTYYDPDADCPTWKMVLNNVFQKKKDKEDVIRHFCEVLGYILQSQKKEAVFLMLLGQGRNGKSFVMKEFQKLMGPDSSLNVEMKKFSEGAHAETSLVGKNMLLDDDWKKGQLLPDDYIKKLSESKLLTANPKFKEQFNFVSRATPVILSNSPPKTKDTSFGLERRAHVFQFDHQFENSEIDTRLDEKLANERSGFLNLLLKSYIDYEKRGYFQMPMSCKASLKEWLKGSNPLLAFLDEKVIITKDATDTVKSQKLFDMYKEYVEKDNFSHSLTRNNFYEDVIAIQGLFLKRNSTDKNMYFHGLKIKTF